MRTNRTALVLIEEGILLLRKSPALVFALYCAGTVPFLLALLSFCAEMSYNRNADENCAASAVAVALTYCWMKGLQAFCCRELVRVYTGNVNRWWKPTIMLAIWSRQIAFHPLGFFIKPLAWLLVFPVSYVSAFFQNLTVLGAAEWSDMRKSWALARLWPKQSYAVSVLLSLLALIVFFDLYAAIFFVAFILKTLLGIESFLTRSYTWAFSPVLLIAIAAIAYFLIDLLTKAIEVIRCCDGESLATGADLLRRLATLQNRKPGNGANLRALSGMLLHPEGVQRTSPGVSSSFWVRLLLCGALLIAVPLGAADGSIETNAFQSELLTRPALDRQIEQVLQNPEYSWREKSGSDGASPYPKQKSIFEHWMVSIRQMLHSLVNWAGQLLKSLLKPFDLNAPIANPAAPNPPLSFGLLNALGYLLWAAFAGSLILLLIRIVKLKATKLPPSIVPAQKPDLADERFEASQLRDNEWYALAREKMAVGEFRQAQRALFLAILSYLASRDLITFERWKSNIDYEKELGRKAKHLSELRPLFAQSRLGFERCWYGAGGVTAGELETYSSIYERIKDAGG